MGFLPSKNELKNYVEANDLKFNEYNSYADDYANTLIIWRKNLMKSGKQLKVRDLI